MCKMTHGSCWLRHQPSHNSELAQAHCIKRCQHAHAGALLITQTQGSRVALQVFISEQVLYTDKELKQHGRAGDVTGALAESGFSGHPSCRFCRRQFYGDTELFVHMHQTHEQCFLCRRARPDKYVYYRNYAELEGACRPSSWMQQHAPRPLHVALL